MLYVPLLIVTHIADPRLAAVLAQPIIVGAALAGHLDPESRAPCRLLVSRMCVCVSHSGILVFPTALKSNSMILNELI